jgi:hypothetical protein
MEKFMVIENQENRLRRAALTFTVPACGFVVAARTQQFQLTQRTAEQVDFPGTRPPAGDSRSENNLESSLREPRHQTASLKLSKIKQLIFLVLG